MKTKKAKSKSKPSARQKAKGCRSPSSWFSAWAVKIKEKDRPLPFLFEFRENALASMGVNSNYSRADLELVEVKWRALNAVALPTASEPPPNT